MQVGANQLVGLEKSCYLSWDLVEYLQYYGLKTMDQFRVMDCDFPTNGTYWLAASDLDLTGTSCLEWDNYVVHLAAAGVQLCHGNDKLVFSFNKKLEHVSATLAYLFLAENHLSAINY